MTPPHRPAALAAGLLIALCAAGCGPGEGTYPVEGTVVFEGGKPARELAGGTVSFESVADKSNASGVIQADGTFRIKTPRGSDGARPGQYRVLVLPPEPDDADRRPPPALDKSYERYDTSGIEITVKEEANKIPIKVRRAKRG